MQVANETMEVALSTGKIMFFYFLNNLLDRKLAKVNDVNSNIINLDSFSSNWFVIGRSVVDDKLDNPFIGIPEDMIPWFLELNWTRVLVDYDNGHIYLTCAESKEESDFTLRISARVNRLNVFKSSDANGFVNSLDFRIFKFETTNDLTVSNKVYKRCAIEEFDGIDSVVALHEDDRQLFENNNTFKKYDESNSSGGNVKFFGE